MNMTLEAKREALHNRPTRYFSYDLYNTDTEQVEATENHTPDEIRSRNDILRANGEPQRWIATPWVNH